MRVLDRQLYVRGTLVRVGHLEGDKYEELSDPASALEIIRRSGTRVDLFTFMQILPQAPPQYPYPMELDNLAVINISTFEHWWTKQLNNKTRNMVRRAEKNGVVVREVPFDEGLVRGITAIYNEVPSRQGKPFPHYGKDVDAVRSMTATFLDQSVFIGAYLDESLVGFAKLVSDRCGRQASLMHIVSMYHHRDKAPTNAVIAQAVRSCADRNIPYLVYSNFSYGKKTRDALSDFKEHNGFRRVDLPRYYVPLTRLGAFALRLGLHHRRTEYLPTGVVRKLRALRNSWYSRAVS